MPLNTTIAKGVAIANKLTRSAQVEVIHKQWIGHDDGFGESKFAPGDAIFDPPNPPVGIRRHCIMDTTTRRQRLQNGQEILVEATLTFVETVSAEGTVGRLEPFDPRDEIVLPDGSVIPIAHSGGVVNPSAGLPYATEVLLGRAL